MATCTTHLAVYNILIYIYFCIGRRAFQSLSLDGPAKLEQDLRTMGKNATVRFPWLSEKFQAQALKSCGPRDVGETVRRMLIATIGEDLTSECNWLRTVEKTPVFPHRFVGAIIGRWVPHFQLLSNRCREICNGIPGKVGPGY